jgi:hypothetical protein
VIRASAIIAIAIAVAGCRSSDERKPAATGSARAGSGAGSGSAAGSATPAAADAIDPAMHDFCVRSMEQIKKCF